MLTSDYFDSDVPIGTSKRYVHEGCPKEHKHSAPGRALVVTRTPEGYSFYCHRCHDFGKRTLDGLSPAETIAWIKSINLKPKSYRKKVELPEDFSTKLPATALAFLWARYLTDTDIEQYKLGYSLRYNRLILPVYDSDQLVYWTGRNLGEITKDNPKYINVRQLGRKNIFFSVDQGRDKLVIVESIIDGIRVGCIADCKALLSAFIPDSLIFENKDKEILIFLDHDKLSKAFNWVIRYRSFGINCRLINKTKDPKWYSDEELKEILGDKYESRNFDLR